MFSLSRRKKRSDDLDRKDETKHSSEAFQKPQKSSLHSDPDTHKNSTYKSLETNNTDVRMNAQTSTKDLQSVLQNSDTNNSHRPHEHVNPQWVQGDSWSEILMSDSEKNRRIGTQTKAKDTNMVVLVRRLENFPQSKIIASTRQLFTDELDRLLKVKDVIDSESNQLADQNPILNQALLEVESELSKIEIEKASFEKKLQSEVEIIDGLVQSIIAHENKKPQLISSLLKHYDFDLNSKNIVFHISNEKKEKEQLKQVQPTNQPFSTMKAGEALQKGKK